MITEEPKIYGICSDCKQESELTEYMGCLLCDWCLAFQMNDDHPEDERRDEW